jgi:hypothetical protein
MSYAKDTTRSDGKVPASDGNAWLTPLLSKWSPGTASFRYPDLPGVGDVRIWGTSYELRRGEPNVGHALIVVRGN